MVSLVRSDWSLIGDPGVVRVPGGVNPLNVGPGNAYSLKVPVGGFSVGPPVFTMLPQSPIVALAEVTQSMQGWISVPALTAAASLYLALGVRQGAPASYAIYAFLTSPNSIDIALFRAAGGPPTFVTNTGAIVFTISAPVGIRLRCDDDGGGMKVQASYNLNGSGWTDLYSAVDPAGAPAAGVPGQWAAYFGTQTGIPAGLDYALIDDVEMSNDVPV